MKAQSAKVICSNSKFQIPINTVEICRDTMLSAKLKVQSAKMKKIYNRYTVEIRWKFSREKSISWEL